jgi:predicted  nucleic acid-binding Zn-ribbon protein
MRISGRSLSFFSETETEPSSIASVAEDIQRRIRMMDRETQKHRQKISQMRKRISVRQQSLSGILASLRFPPTRPSSSALGQAVSVLERRIASGAQDLSAILGSEAFASACSLNSDIEICDDESEKLKEAIREAEEDIAAALHDLGAAKGRLAALGHGEIRQIQARIATLIQQFGEQRRRVLSATDMLDESEEEISDRIQTLEGTFHAERMSAARALELEQESAATLRGIAAAAGERIRAALA